MCSAGFPYICFEFSIAVELAVSEIKVAMNAIISNVNEKPPKVAASKMLVAKPSEPTEPFQVFAHSLRFLSYFGMVIGLEISYDWKWGVRFAFTKCLTNFIWSQIIYTQILYVYQGNAVRIWEVFAIYGMAISALLKIACFEKYYKNIRALFDSILRISQQSTGKRADRLKRRLEGNFTLYRFIASLAILIVIIYTFYPVKSFFIDKELVPFVPIEIMFLDQSILLDYLIVSCIMVIVGLYAVMGTEYMALIFVYLIANYSPLVDVLEVDFDELNELWSNTKASTLAHRHSFLRNICRKYNDLKQYIAEVKVIFDQKMYIFFTFAYLSQIMCMYQVRVNHWVPGYALAIGFFFEMIFYCIMGTQLTIQNERLCYIITQSKWYTYDLKSQKMIKSLLYSAQNSVELWIGPLAPLSVYTSTEIIKSIYTYYTVMTEVM